ncbi:MAG: CDP-alcohol phosphatidyltransferase family protein [Dehalococcoidia bacterium]
MDLPGVRRKLAHKITSPIVGTLSKLGVTPNTLTFINLGLNILAGYVISMGHFLIGGILVLISGLCDILDGAVARLTGRSTKFGAILDSTVDRIAEAAVLCGLLLWYIQDGPQENRLAIVLVFIVLVGSFLVSYVKARAEGVGWQCQVGLFTRAERVIVLALGLLIDQVFIALCILSVFVSFTVVQRLVHLWRQARTGGD